MLKNYVRNIWFKLLLLVSMFVLIPNQAEKVSWTTIKMATTDSKVPEIVSFTLLDGENIHECSVVE